MNKQSKFEELEERTLRFARDVIFFCNCLSKTSANRVIVNQIIRSAGSVGANYREANDALSKKDFILRVRISRKEAKETEYWLRLIQETNEGIKDRCIALLQECNELRSILTAILKKTD